jgi:electron transport complex protein RnfE
MKAFFYGLYQVLGIFIPLIVVNCAVIGRAEAFASKNRADLAVIDGLSTGLGFTGVLVLLGGMRELLGHGTLLAHADLMFGAAGAWLQITLFEDYRGFLLAVLPPGAFIGLALLIAAKNALERRLARARPVAAAELVPPARA